MMTCARCGADLAPLMRLAAGAWSLREAARLALLAGEDTRALALARAAHGLERTPRARQLLVLALVATENGEAARAVLGDAPPA
jgi:hypothetical protein